MIYGKVEIFFNVMNHLEFCVVGELDGQSSSVLHLPRSMHFFVQLPKEIMEMPPTQLLQINKEGRQNREKAEIQKGTVPLAMDENTKRTFHSFKDKDSAQEDRSPATNVSAKAIVPYQEQAPSFIEDMVVNIVQQNIYPVLLTT